jgi:hypothetical protein
MADPLKQTLANPMSAAPTAASSGSSEPEIHVIPEKFYGAALRARIAEVKKEHPDAEPKEGDHPAGKKGGWIVAMIVGIVLLLGVGGGFVYFNKDLLFSKPSPTPTPEPTPTPTPTPPAIPENLSATATSPNIVSLTWTDKASDETAYRIERRGTATSFAPIQSLAANEQAYADSSAAPETTYVYRVVAVSAGGESPSNEATVATPALPPPPPEQVKLPPVGLDTDSDGLTDLEEPMYGSPINNPDADGDSFLDGNEVFHLYSPSGKAPGKLLESKLVRVFESPIGWKVYVPTPWQTSLNEDGTKGSILSGHGETFTLTLLDNPEHQAILDWYLAQNPGVLSSQVTNVKTLSGFDGLTGADQLTTYFPWGDKVLVVKYDLDDQPFVNFRTTYVMMLNSLTLTTAPQLAKAAETATQPTAPSPTEQSQPSESVQAPKTPPESITPPSSPPPSTNQAPAATQPASSGSVDPKAGDSASNTPAHDPKSGIVDTP